MEIWQPYLVGPSIRLRPLTEADFEPLFVAASDPLIWEQHPAQDRYQRGAFRSYFQSGLESKGALVVIDRKTGEIIGTSRYTDHSAATSSVEIGYTFLTRAYWGGTCNLELKTLMLDYAFQQVETAYFAVGKDNLRSRRAMAKLGAVELSNTSGLPLSGDLSSHVVFRILKADWIDRERMLPPFVQPCLESTNLLLESIDASHAEELCGLFADSDLHHFVPFEPPTLERQRERCERWAKRRSPDGKDLWLNWIARHKSTGQAIGHLQAGLGQDGVASIGYLIARDFQGRGLATEALREVFDYLRRSLGAKEVKAWTDTRNEASHRLAKKLGMAQVELIKNAEFFKGASSDEFVFSKVF